MDKNAVFEVSQALGLQVFKPVLGKELEEYTKLGWKLVAVLSAHEQQTVETKIPLTLEEQRQVNNSGYYSGNSHRTEYTNVLAPVLRYLIGQDENSTLARVQEELEQQRLQLTAAEEEARHGEREIAKLTKELAQCHKQLKTTEAEERRQHESCVQAGKLNYKLESDISKIRIAIGEQAMKKILQGE